MGYEDYELVGWDDDEEEGEVGASEYDIVGDMLDDDEELVEGADDYEIVGARRRRIRRPRRNAARRIMARGASVVKGVPLSSKRRYLLGFAITTLTAGNSQNIPANPQNLFRSERLVVPSDIAFDLGIQAITVGTQSQFAQSVEVPAAVFSEVAVDTAVMFDTAQIGNQVSVDARNKSGADLSFTAAMIGTLAKK